MRAAAGDDVVALLLLRWTGFRGGDAVKLTWNEVHFDRREIELVTQKRRKKAILPIHTELLFALEINFESRKPASSDPVLLNSATATPMTRTKAVSAIPPTGEARRRF
jgi:integrase